MASCKVKKQFLTIANRFFISLFYERAMAAKYKKIDPRVWKDDRFRSLNEVEKLIAMYVITAQSNRIGIFNFSTALGAEDLGMAPGRFQEGFGRVVLTLKWQWDSVNRVCYLPTWWRYNQPDGANVLMGCLADLDDLPSSPLLEMFCDNTDHLKQNLHDTFKEGCRRVRGGVGGRFAYQEHEQEQEQEQEQDGCFEMFWKAFPSARRQAKGSARHAWLEAIKRCKPQVIIDAAIEYAASRVGKGRYVRGPVSWLSGDCWDDDRSAWNGSSHAGRHPTADELEAEDRARAKNNGRS